jgi:rubrerythrin
MEDTIIKMHVFLDSCYELESSCARMYYLFAELFNEDEQVSLLWEKTALEEENHARHVQLAMKMVPSISWVCLDSWHNATATVEMIKQTICSVQESPPTLQDAIIMALECESRMENFHMHNAILVKENVGNSMFKALKKADHEHIEMLETALGILQKNNDTGCEGIYLEELTPLDVIEYDQLGICEILQ